MKCSKCGYDMGNLQKVCPVCGESAKSEPLKSEPQIDDAQVLTAENDLEYESRFIQKKRSVGGYIFVVTVTILSLYLLGNMAVQMSHIIKGTLFADAKSQESVENASPQSEKTSDVPQEVQKESESLNKQDADSTEVRYVTVGRYNLRAEATTNSAIIKTLDEGSICYGTGEISDDQTWTQIRLDDGTVGWISGKALKAQ